MVKVYYCGLTMRRFHIQHRMPNEVKKENNCFFARQRQNFPELNLLKGWTKRTKCVERSTLYVRALASLVLNKRQQLT